LYTMPFGPRGALPSFCPPVCVVIDIVWPSTLFAPLPFATVCGVFLPFLWTPLVCFLLDCHAFYPSPPPLSPRLPHFLFNEPSLLFAFKLLFFPTIGTPPTLNFLSFSDRSACPRRFLENFSLPPWAGPTRLGAVTFAIFFASTIIRQSFRAGATVLHEVT